MTLQIIDASVAIKWFVPEDSGRAAALSLLEELRDQPWNFAVPELFFNEMLAVLCKLFDRAEEVRDLLGILQDLGWERLGNGRQCLDQAAQIAKRHGLTGYDAVYAANAKLTGGQWVTADARAHKKVASLKISRLLGH